MSLMAYKKYHDEDEFYHVDLDDPKEQEKILGTYKEISPVLELFKANGNFWTINAMYYREIPKES